jgi:hypothetical protein
MEHRVRYRFGVCVVGHCECKKPSLHWNTSPDGFGVEIPKCEMNFSLAMRGFVSVQASCVRGAFLLCLVHVGFCDIIQRVFICSHPITIPISTLIYIFYP